MPPLFIHIGLLLMEGAARVCHPLKPFILDALVRWCLSNHLTPVLVAGRSDELILPPYLMNRDGDLAFNIGSKAVTERSISTSEISFITYFKNAPSPERIQVPVACWKQLRVKETHQQFDLSFAEQAGALSLKWPDGISLQSPEQLGHKRSDRISQKPALTLVWDKQRDSAQQQLG